MEAAPKQYIDTGLGGKQGTGNYLTSLTGDIAASGPGAGSATVTTVGGVGSASIATGANAANSATSSNTAQSLVRRDPQGNFSAGTITANVLGNVNGAASQNILKAGDSMSGFLILNQDPTANLGAATKNYVDTKLLGGVLSFNSRQGAVSLLGSDVVVALGYNPINRSGDANLGSLGLSSGSSLGLGSFDDTTEGTFASGLGIADVGKTWFNTTSFQMKYWNGSSVKAVGVAGNYITGLSGDISASGPGIVGATVNSVGGESAANVASGAIEANSATSANILNRIVKRDGSGNFSAGTITAALDGNVTGDLVGNVTGAATSNILRSGDSMTGFLSLFSDPTTATHAATKNYVDFKFSTPTVTSFNTRTGAVILSSSDVLAALGFTPANRGGDTLTGFLTLSSNPTASLHAATKNYVDQGLSGKQATGNYVTGLTGDIAASGPGNVAGTVNSVGGVSAANLALGANAANSATQANTATALVKRDGNGNFSAGTITSALIGTVTGTASNNILRAGDAMTGFLSLSSDPTALLHAATKNYVDFIASSTGVQTFNSRSGAVSLSLTDVTGALTFSPANKAGDTFSGFITLNANPTSNLHASTKNYVDLGLATKQATGNYVTGLSGDVSASGPGNVAGTVNTVGGVSAANVASGANAANSAASANTASTLVKRDGSGNFSAGVITATLSGNATSATTATTFTGPLAGDITGNQSATTVSTVSGVSAANVALGVNAANAGTSTATGSTLVRRDVAGNFSAGTISAALTGNVTGSASSNILRSGDAMTGFLSLSSDPTALLHAATKNYVDFIASTTGVQSFNSRSGTVVLSLTDVTNALTYSPANKAGDTFSGFITLSANPTSNFHASTKNYVDLGLATKQATGNYVTGLSGDVSATGPGNVAGTVNSVGGVSAANLALGANAANAAASANTASTLVKRDSSGNFSAGVITAALSGNATSATTATSFTGSLSGDVTGTQGSTAVATVGGVSAANVALGANAANAGTSTATSSAIVRRDVSGNFAAGTIAAALSGNVVGNVTGNVTGSASSNILRSGDAMTGYLSLNSDPTALLQAATKNYVDFKASTTGVQTFNSRTNAVTLLFSDVTGALSFDPANVAGDTFTGFVTLNANPTANLHASTKNYVDLGLATKQGTGSYLTALTGDVSASGPGSSAGTVNTVGGVTAANVALGANAANAAASANTASTLVKRDSSGNFSAGVITATLSGNATSATTSTSFTGSLAGDVTGTQGSTAVATVGGVSAANVALGANAANAGTSTATSSAIVRRDVSGNFAAGTITAALSGNVVGNVTGNVTGSASSNILRSGDAMTGFLSLNSDPTALLQAATKNYVDFKASTTGVQTFNSRAGAVTLSFADVTTSLACSCYRHRHSHFLLRKYFRISDKFYRELGGGCIRYTRFDVCR